MNKIHATIITVAICLAALAVVGSVVESYFHHQYVKSTKEECTRTAGQTTYDDWFDKQYEHCLKSKGL